MDIKKNPDATYKNKQWLEEQMRIFGSGEKIAKNYNVSASNIQKWMKKLGVKNGSINKSDEAPYKNKEWLISQYKLGKTSVDIAEEVGVDQRSVAAYAKKLDLSPKEIFDQVKYPYKNKEWLKKQVEIHGNGLAIAKENNLPPNSVNRYITKYGLIKRKYKTKKKNFQNNDFFEVIDTEKKAYWLGFIMADGNMYERKNPVGSKYTLGIYLSSIDESHLNKFKKDIEFTGDIKRRTQKRKETITNGSYIRINNEKFCSDLIDKGVVPRKTGKEYMPLFINQDLNRHFIRGFFDGDGNIHKLKDLDRYSINICSKSKVILLQIKKELELAGISNINYYEKKSLDSLVLYKKEEIKRFLRYIYENATVYLERKYKSCIKLIN